MANIANLFKKMGDEKDDPSTDNENSEQDRKGFSFSLLFVDDEPGVLKAMKRLFLDENYAIFLAENSADALKIMERETIHLVVTDHRMPGMTGAQLLREIRKNWPETIRIMLTGYADVQSIMGAVNEGSVFKFITKPWNDEDLRLTVSLALQQYALIQENKQLRKITAKQHAQIKKFSIVLDENKGLIGNYLLNAGLLSQEDFDWALQEKQEGELLGDTLVRLGFVTESKIVGILQKNLKLEYIDLKEKDLLSGVVKFLPRQFCERNKLIPVAISNKKLTLAMADPSDVYKCDNIAMMLSMNVEPVIAKSSDILKKIKNVYGEDLKKEDSSLEIVSDFEPLDEIDIVIEEEDDSLNINELVDSSEVPPVIRIVNAIISEAIRYRTSDIHIEPKTKYTAIRFRIDGMLYSKIRIPHNIHLATISRIKILAKMDIAERRVPQDGRITVKSGTRLVDIRVSTMPTINGEKVVMRILDKSSAVKALDELGVLATDFSNINFLIKRPQGIIISTGPTGSGKTTMLYSILNSMLQSTKNFQTIEDPVEYFLEEANQIFVKEKVGLSFSSVLRSTLRQDPDVILVGEIRDLETADVAFKAALTGHMVLTTLHTNNSVASITRLLDIGIRPYLIASAIEGIIAQRLVRKICKYCRQPVAPSEEILNLLKISPELVEGHNFMGKGCDRCNHTGYNERTGIFELFIMNDDFRHVISSNYKEAELIKMARVGGMLTLLEDGIEKVKTGETTLEEILRVIGSQTRYERKCEACDHLIDVNFIFCPYCGKFKNNYCVNCKIFLEDEWCICPFCGNKKHDDFVR